MGLLILPLRTATESVDLSIREVLEEFLSTLRLGRGRQGPNKRPSEPAIVVPEIHSLWRGHEQRVFVNGGQVLLPETDQAASVKADCIEGPLRRAIDAMMRHRADCRHSEDADDLDSPGLIISPVMCIPSGIRGDELLGELKRLAVAVGWLDSVVLSLGCTWLSRPMAMTYQPLCSRARPSWGQALPIQSFTRASHRVGIE
jgi:hypothetical protein